MEATGACDNSLAVRALPKKLILKLPNYSEYL